MQGFFDPAILRITKLRAFFRGTTWFKAMRTKIIYIALKRWYVFLEIVANSEVTNPQRLEKIRAILSADYSSHNRRSRFFGICKQSKNFFRNRYRTWNLIRPGYYKCDHHKIGHSFSEKGQLTCQHYLSICPWPLHSITRKYGRNKIKRETEAVF